jgi:hypothetical protein
MPSYLQRALHPDWYHGHGRKPPFFEGWYYKLIDPTTQHKYAVIPGIFLNTDPALNTAFVQVLDGMSAQSAYFTYPVEDFQAAPDAFEVRVGPNHFRADRLTLDLSSASGEGAVERLALRADLRFSGGVGWPVTWASPGIMGPFGWLNFMECNHGVVSFDHRIEGQAGVNGQPIDFSGGRGYIEKDWGQSFPAGYIWMQTNHFPTVGTCLTASIAVIPNFGFTWPGFIVGLWLGGRLYRFASYTGAQVEKLVVTDEQVDWVMRGSGHRLHIQAARAEGGLLHEPTRTQMHRRVEETLSARVRVKLMTLDGETRFEETGDHAGMEVYGDLRRLLKG